MMEQILIYIFIVLFIFTVIALFLIYEFTILLLEAYKEIKKIYIRNRNENR